MNLRNKKGWKHGYCEFKHPKGKLSCKHTFNNGILVGYREWYHLWFIDNKNGKIRCKEINI